MTERGMRRGLVKQSGLPALAEFHSVLVPVDLTPITDRVLGRLALLRLADAARVTLLHVVPQSLPAAEQRRATRDAQRALAEEVRHVRRLLPKTANVEPLLRLGTAATEIGACASQARAELIVMGRSGGSPLRDAFLGSTAERVIRQARLPVLAVRSAARAGYRRPALALDLEPSAEAVIRLMLRVLPAERPVVDVIHAVAAPYGRLIYPSVHAAAVEEMKGELRAQATHELKKLLATSLGGAGVEPRHAPSWRTHVRCGSPRMLVQNVMKRAETDLLVLGSRGYSGAAYVFLGTVAGDLLRAADCDVLVVPPAARR